MTKYPSVTLTGAIQLDCILVFLLCGGFCFSGCMFLWLHVSPLYGMPTAVAAKSVPVLIKEEMCQYHQLGIFPANDRILVH